MEARFSRLAALVSLCGLLVVSMGARFKSPNFVVDAATPELAKKIATAAERYRHDLAIEWIGKAMPDWSRPCPITAHVSPKTGAGGETSFVFDKGEVFEWKMKIFGTEERVLDSVLPHEVTHTIFASYFRRPLPRWADEGACTTMEHESERNKQHRLLYEFLRTNRGIAFSQMFVMEQYPEDILPLYAQGYSLARYLIQQGGKQKFLKFLGEGMDSRQWASVLQKHYGYKGLGDLQSTWLKWVEGGSHDFGTETPEKIYNASLTRETNDPQTPATNAVINSNSGRGYLKSINGNGRPRNTGAVVYRGQNDEIDTSNVARDLNDPANRLRQIESSQQAIQREMNGQGRNLDDAGTEGWGPSASSSSSLQIAGNDQSRGAFQQPNSSVANQNFNSSSTSNNLSPTNGSANNAKQSWGSIYDRGILPTANEQQEMNASATSTQPSNVQQTSERVVHLEWGQKVMR